MQWQEYEKVAIGGASMSPADSRLRCLKIKALMLSMAALAIIQSDRWLHLPSSDELPYSDHTPVDDEDQNLIPNILLFLLKFIWATRNDWFFGIVNDLASCQSKRKINSYFLLKLAITLCTKIWADSGPPNTQVSAPIGYNRFCLTNSSSCHTGLRCHFCHWGSSAAAI